MQGNKLNTLYQLQNELLPTFHTSSSLSRCCPLRRWSGSGSAPRSSSSSALSSPSSSFAAAGPTSSKVKIVFHGFYILFLQKVWWRRSVHSSGWQWQRCHEPCLSLWCGWGLHFGLLRNRTRLNHLHCDVFQAMALYGMPLHLTFSISLSLGPVAQPHSRILLLTSHRIQIFQTFDRQSKQQWNSTNQWKIHFGNTFYGTNQNNWNPIKLNNQWRGCAMGSRDFGNIWVPIFETRIFAQATPCQVWRHHSFSISDLIWRPPQPSCLTA